jgi:RHS repeat-associated protein
MLISTQTVGGSQSMTNVYAGDQWYRVSENLNGTTKKFGWRRDELYAEFDGSGNLTAGYLNNGVDQPLYKTRFSSNGTVVEGRDFYHQDQNLRVHHVTNGNGQIAEKYVYNGYGKRTILDAQNNEITATAIGNRIGFQGREHEDLTGDAQEDGLTFHRNRFYSPGLGRWERRDPIGYEGGHNLFGLFKYNRISLFDPKGLDDIRIDEDAKEPNVVIWMPEGFIGWDQSYNKQRLGTVDENGVVHFDPALGLGDMPLEALQDYGSYDTFKEVLEHVRKAQDEASKREGGYTGGLSVADYYFYRVTKEECCNHPAGKIGAEDACRKRISVAAGRLSAGQMVTGAGELIVGGVVQIAQKVPLPPVRIGAAIVGGILAGGAIKDARDSIAIVTTGKVAADIYCICPK